MSTVLEKVETKKENDYSTSAIDTMEESADSADSDDKIIASANEAEKESGSEGENNAVLKYFVQINFKSNFKYL
jgi:hypothetical protein